MIAIYAVLGYALVVWVGVRLIVPHLGFAKDALPTEIPIELREKISAWNHEAKGDREFLQLAYEYVTSTYTGSRLKTVTQCSKAFGNVFLQPPGFLPCTGQNYILRTMLVQSGRFQDTDIEVSVVPLNLSIHQYLRVRMGDTFIDVDPWSHFLGVPLGKKSMFFG